MSLVRFASLQAAAALQRSSARQGIFARNCQLANAGARLAGNTQDCKRKSQQQTAWKQLALRLALNLFFFARAREFQEHGRAFSSTQFSKKLDLRSQDSMPANGTRVKNSTKNHPKSENQLLKNAASNSIRNYAICNRYFCIFCTFVRILDTTLAV